MGYQEPHAVIVIRTLSAIVERVEGAAADGFEPESMQPRDMVAQLRKHWPDGGLGQRRIAEYNLYRISKSLQSTQRTAARIRRFFECDLDALSDALQSYLSRKAEVLQAEAEQIQQHINGQE